MKHEFKTKLLRRDIDYIQTYNDKHLYEDFNPIRCNIDWSIEFDVCKSGIEISTFKLHKVSADIEIYDPKEEDYNNITREYEVGEGVYPYRYKFIYEGKQGAFMLKNIEIDDSNNTIEITVV